MTPQEVRDAFIAFKREVGPESNVYVSVCTDVWPSEVLSASVYPRGICNDIAFIAKADAWAELIAKTRAGWEAHKDESRARTIRKMALEIIRVTAEHGECTDAALRMTFTQEEISRLGKDACADADEIASNGPFGIVSQQSANAA